jgi:Rad51
MAQLDRSQRGLDSGVAYFTTSAFLPVKRLAEIAGTHPVLQGCDPKSLTDNVHNCSTTSIPALLSALKVALVQLFKHVENSKGRLKPVRVLIIDSLGSLFHSLDKTTTTTLVERSKILNEFSHLIHGLAFSKQAAVIVINQVTDVFHTESYPTPVPTPNNDHAPPELIYKDQSIWFNRPPPSAGLYPEREATMGLIWANQVNIRIMVSRTRRRLRSLEDVDNHSSNKRRKGSGVPSTINEPAVSMTIEEQEEAEAGMLIRSLSVVFSAVSSPCTLEFVIVKEGIRVTDFRADISSKPLPLAQLQSPVVPRVSEETAAPSIPQSQGFISARLTQHNHDATVNTARDAIEGVHDDEAKEDFDTFDEEEWASYGVALGDLEEQWDEPELEPGNHSGSEGDENEIQVLESSDVEENFLLDNMLENSTQP